VEITRRAGHHILSRPSIESSNVFPATAPATILASTMIRLCLVSFAELRAAMAANAEASGEDRVQRVMLDGAPNLAPPLGSNHQLPRCDRRHRDRHFDHSVRRFSMATGQDLNVPFVLTNPNDAPAPYKLGTE